jgi:uncharacterized phage-associated protein
VRRIADINSPARREQRGRARGPRPRFQATPSNRRYSVVVIGGPRFFDAPVRASILAKWFVARAAGQDDQDLDPMKLQKLLYFAHSRYLFSTSTRLVVEPIQAWKYGPVVRTVYDEFRAFDHNPIQLDLAPDGPWSCVIADVEEVLERTWNAFGGYSGWYLAEITHEVGPHKLHYVPNRNVVIPDEEIAAAWPDFARFAAVPVAGPKTVADAIAKYSAVVAQTPPHERIGSPANVLAQLEAAGPSIREAEALYKRK